MPEETVVQGGEAKVEAGEIGLKEHQVSDTRGSLLGEEVFTEAQLRGEEETPIEEKPKEETPKETPKEAAKEAGSETPGETPEEKPEETPKEKPGTPPPGYVPHAALHEERGKRQSLAARVEELEAELKAVKTKEVTPAPVEETPKFKVLTDAEFEELANEDIVASQVYLKKLADFREQERTKSAEVAKEKEVKATIESIVGKRFQEMEEAVPGLFDENSPVNEQMTTFAVENGFDADYLTVLTDPKTRIVTSDGKVVLLGKGAVGTVKLLYNMMKKANPNIDKELEAAKASGAKEALGKVKGAGGTGGFKDIGDIHAAGFEAPLDTGKKVYTESEFGKLPKEQQEKLLRGTG